MNRRTTRGLAVASAVVVSTTLLAGCADELPQPVPGEAFSGPVLTEEQDTQVFTAVADTVKKADKALKGKDLKPRVTGPAYEVRTSQLSVAKERDNAEFVTDIPSESQQMVIPTTEGWPRTSYSITTSTEDLETPRLVAFEQETARSDYKMWAWTQLIPGVAMPAFADAGIGSEAVAADDDTLAASPTDALAQYADLVTLGAKKSSFAKGFDLPDGDLVAAVAADAAAWKEVPGFEESGTKYTQKYKARKDEVRSVRTADGGALVMGVLDGQTTVEAEDEAKVPALSETQKALLGDAGESNVLKTEYTDMVALYVPAKGSDEKIRPLGYSHVATAASN
ncbi:hypothetical protein [Krasilnikoviella flava]|uniref:DUF8094 domain-containing protein n=1 Tax=Krasilnikoviella flava TaxID=526729 RepID=A0A1T5I7H8_9MICO|nr:hypothetical protein [Krasilnikoviella flava]SKC35099.1 hypothetical protein SAMN04324258_0093 [Krasilnikoviella flava]